MINWFVFSFSPFQFYNVTTYHPIVTLNISIHQSTVKMKTATALFLSSFCTSTAVVSAWTPTSSSRRSFIDQAAKLVPLVVVASPAFAADDDSRSSSSTSTSSNMLLSESASLDFSLPTYDTKMGGFGEGTEAYTKKGGEMKTSTAEFMADPGADEKEKQLASMRKAEEARKDALAQKKAVQKEREAEDKRRAKEKKERDAERLKNIWSS